MLENLPTTKILENTNKQFISQQQLDLINAVNTNFTNHINDIDAHSTIGDKNYYISTTGNDNNNGLSSITAFKTIQKAINIISFNCNHNIIINIAVGVYNETITIGGFIGNGSISIKGATVLSDSYLVNNFIVKNTIIPINIFGMKANSITAHAYTIIGCNNVTIDTCKTDSTTAVYDGVNISAGFAIIANSTINNRNNGLITTNAANCFCNNSSGTNNQIGCNATNGSTLARNITSIYPKGKTNTITSNGGILR